MQRHRISFKHALVGVKYALSTQPNFRIHLILAATAIVLAGYFRLTQAEWLILLFTITLVLVAEMINTALEAVTDLLTDQLRPQAKIAKDVSAGVVLLTAILSLVIGLVIFIPHLWPSY